MTEGYRYRKPRKVNWVSLLILGGLVVAGYLAWLYGPVYWQRYKVDEILSDVAFKSQDLGGTDGTGQEELEAQRIDEARTRIQALGIAPEGHEEDLDVFFNEDYTYLIARYRVRIDPIVGGPRTLEFERVGKIPQADVSTP